MKKLFGPPRKFVIRNGENCTLEEESDEAEENEKDVGCYHYWKSNGKSSSSSSESHYNKKVFHHYGVQDVLDSTRHLSTTMVPLILSTSPAPAQAVMGNISTPVQTPEDMEISRSCIDEEMPSEGVADAEEDELPSVLIENAVSNSDATPVPKEAESQRSLVIRELVQTEKDYVNDLNEVVKGYMAIMRDPNSELPMPQDLQSGKDKIVFGNLERIYEWHRDIFSKGLERCLEHPQELGDLFIRHERRLRHMYVVYCQNKPLSEFIVTDHIDSYFEEIRIKLSHDLTLCDLLIKPVQRIMKYQLLLKDILKYTQRMKEKVSEDEVRKLKSATVIMYVVPKEANDMMSVGRLQGFNGNITAQGKLLLSGSLMITEEASASTGKELQLFFFEQSIILSEAVGKKTAFSNPIYIYKAHILVNNMRMSVDKCDASKFTLISTDPKKPSMTFVCTAPNPETKEEWVTTLGSVLQRQNDFAKILQDPIMYQKNNKHCL